MRQGDDEGPSDLSRLKYSAFKVLRSSYRRKGTTVSSNGIAICQTRVTCAEDNIWRCKSPVLSNWNFAVGMITI